MTHSRIYLHPPATDDREIAQLIEVMKSGWVSTVGPALDLFEQRLEQLHRNKRVLALNSGTSALHLALKLAGVGEGDPVGVSSLTFCASANVVLYEKAIPVFFDSEDRSWNLNPELLEGFLQRQPLKALILTHLFGMPARINDIKTICEKYGVSLIEDAAGALGSTFDGQAVGTFGTYGIVSFNGNKIVTTSGGGALICDDTNYEKGLKLATQAKESGSTYYKHLELGYNYRLSNVLAGLGVAQLSKLRGYLSRKKDLFEYYRAHLPEKWFKFQETVGPAVSNHWLTSIVFQEPLRGAVMRQDLIDALEKANIESRPIWRPMHLQPLYDGCQAIGGDVSKELFEYGICLPSGVNLSLEDQDRIIQIILDLLVSRGLS